MKSNDPALTELNLNNIQVGGDAQFGKYLLHDCVLRRILTLARHPSCVK